MDEQKQGDGKVEYLYCRACGARDWHDCICPRFEIPLAENTEQQ
jgi:hypothetical protein